MIDGLIYFVAGVSVFVVGNLILNGIKGNKKITTDTFYVFTNAVEKRFDAMESRLTSIEGRIARIEEILLQRRDK